LNSNLYSFTKVVIPSNTCLIKLQVYHELNLSKHRSIRTLTDRSCLAGITDVIWKSSTLDSINPILDKVLKTGPIAW